jgi:drug/metabolite transporter (DMT)-like permease
MPIGRIPARGPADWHSGRGSYIRRKTGLTQFSGESDFAAYVGPLGLSRATLTIAGVGFALLAAAAWACYILLSVQTGRRWQGISGIAIASMVGAIALAPPAILAAGSVMLDSACAWGCGWSAQFCHPLQL